MSSPPPTIPWTAVVAAKYLRSTLTPCFVKRAASCATQIGAMTQLSALYTARKLISWAEAAPAMSMIPTNTTVSIARPDVVLRVIRSLPEMNFFHLINRHEIFQDNCKISFLFYCLPQDGYDRNRFASN